MDLQRLFYRQAGLPDSVFTPRITNLFNLTIQSRGAEKKNEVMLYGEIVSDLAKEEASSFGINSGLVGPTEFREQLHEAAAETDEVTLRINSRGGEIFSASAMYSAIEEIRGDGKQVSVHIDGVAASAASFVMLAANRRFVHKLSSVMIHSANALAIGNSEELRRMADSLEGQDRKVAKVYSEHMNSPEDDVVALMSKETWFHGQDIVDSGLATHLVSDGNRGMEQRMRQRDLEATSLLHDRFWKF